MKNMKYLLLLSILLFAGCSTPQYIVTADKCDKYEPNLLHCKVKGSVQKLK